MTEQSIDKQEALEQFKNLLKKNERLGEGAAWLIVRNGSLSCRKFSIITGTDPERLRDLGIVKINKGGKPMFHIDRFHDEGRAVHEGSMEDINRDLLTSLEEVQEAGYTIPVELEMENLVFRLDSKNDWLQQINAEVRRGETEKSQNVDESTFGYPLLVRKGRSLSLTDRGTEICKELDVMDEFDPRYAQRLDEAQEVGVYTAINEETEVFFSWIYSKFKEAELSQEQMEFVLRELESNLMERELSETDVDREIRRAKDFIDHEETDEE